MMLMLVQLSSYQHVTLVIGKRNQKVMLEHQSYYLRVIGGSTYSKERFRDNLGKTCIYALGNV